MNTAHKALLLLGGAGGGELNAWVATMQSLGAVTHLSAAAGLYTNTGASSAAEDGEAVKAWRDQLAAQTAIQAATANAPIYRASVAAFNNQPALEFGGDDWLQIASGFTAWNTLLSANQHAIYVVGQWSGFAQVLCYATSSTTSALLRMYNNPASLRLQAYLTPDTGSSNLPFVSSDADPHLYARIRTATNSAAAYRDGVAGNTQTTVTGVVTLDKLTIGANNLLAELLTGYICDIIAFGAEGVTNQLAIEAAINERYALWE